jgi:hypothetical protein
MSFSKLYEFSAGLRTSPVILEGVLDAKVIELTAQDDIYYVPVDLDPAVSKGHIKQYRESTGVYSEAKWITEIRYFKDLNVCWHRYVCCKELMHVFDTPEERTSSAEKLDQLLGEIESPLPSDRQSPMFQSETRTLWMALAVLCPLPLRDHFQPMWADGTMSEYEIALELRIPEELIQPIMSDRYHGIVQSLIS